MPQIETTTATPLGYVIATMQAQIDAMVTNMSYGNPINASDVATLVSLYNDFVAHYHPTNDLRGIDTFGNLGVYGAGTYTTNATTTPSGFATETTPTGVGALSEITAADINSIIGFINSVRIHTHDITDVVS